MGTEPAEIFHLNVNHFVNIESDILWARGHHSANYNGKEDEESTSFFKSTEFILKCTVTLD